MRMAPPEENADPTADPWAEFIRVTAPEFRKPTIEQIETVTKPIWEALVAGEQYSPRDGSWRSGTTSGPTWSCTDNVTGYPSVELAGAPWVRFVSANPLGDARRRSAAGAQSGCPIDDRSQWQAFKEEYHRQHEALLTEHNDFRASVGVAPCPIDEFNTNSPWLQPLPVPRGGRLSAVDTARSHLAPAATRRCAPTEEPFDVDAMVPGDGKVVYLSLGSLGCMDVGLMQRLIDAMATTEHRTIVSMGPLKDQMTLGPNMYGDQFLPQPSILPQCDLLITHGGNNTMCEGFHFGLPMIGLPLFWDQYDNAQRLRETGFGVRLATYDWTTEELVAAVNRLLGDDSLHATMARNAEVIRADPGRVKGADLIERVAVTGEPVTR